MTAVVSGREVHGKCGPLRLHVDAADDALARVAENYCALYGDAWDDACRDVFVRMERGEDARRASGTFLSAAHMTVDRDGDSYFADTQYGFRLSGTRAGACDTWAITVPFGTVFDEPQVGDMEDLFSLICTSGWRHEKWLALHAGAVMKNETCAILCAQSGGGKSTLTTALVMNGWKTLGDDKLLLRFESGTPRLRALLGTFNLDPATRRWFDLGDLEALPRYSAFTNKRRVRLDAIDGGAASRAAVPTHVVRVMRNGAIRGARVTPLPRGETMPALLKQIVLPSDRETAVWIVSQCAAAASAVRPVQLEIGDDAYASGEWLAAIEDALL